MACSVPRQVGATYKAHWTTVKKNAEHRKAGWTKKRYKGLDHAPKFISPTLIYQYGKDYSFKKKQHLSVLTLSGRVIVPYSGYREHLDLVAKGAQIGAANLWYNKPRKRFFLLVSLEVECDEPTPQTHKHVVGVDVGVRYLAVTSTTKGDGTFFSGKQVRAKGTQSQCGLLQMVLCPTACHDRLQSSVEKVDRNDAKIKHFRQVLHTR